MDKAAEQRNVLRGIAASVVLIVLWFGVALTLLPAPHVAAGPGARLAFALKWDLAVIACPRRLLSLAVKVRLRTSGRSPFPAPPPLKQLSRKSMTLLDRRLAKTSENADMGMHVAGTRERSAS